MNLPASFLERIKLQLYNEYDFFAKAMNEAPPVSIRMNPAKVSLISGDSIPWASNGIYLNKRPSFTLDPLLHAGAYYVQEASSMLIEQFIKKYIDKSMPVKVLDLCSAPGGKATHVASLINKESLLVANEVIRSRASILRENIIKWGASNILVTCNDPSAFTSLNDYFDVIIIDAPCSGEGMFRKDPAAAAEWSENNIQLCSERQQRILSDIWPALKSGGMLIYSTCTFNEKEDEEILQWIGDEKEADSLEIETGTAWNIQKCEKGKYTGYKCWPHKVKGEGFFIGAVKKNATQDQRSIKTKKNILPVLGKSIASEVKNWYKEPEYFHYINLKETVLAFPLTLLNDIEFLSQKLNVIKTGIETAYIKQNKTIPAHDLALCPDFNSALFPSANLDLPTALRFLRKDEFAPPESISDWSVMKYKDIPLGWVKKISNRMNNYYPVEWRIRMEIKDNELADIPSNAMTGV